VKEKKIGKASWEKEAKKLVYEEAQIVPCSEEGRRKPLFWRKKGVRGLTLSSRRS